MNTPTEVHPGEYHTRLTLDRSDVLSGWLSKSAIWDLSDKSLFKWRYGPRPEPTASMSWGSLVDTLATTPELRDELVAVSPFDSFRTKEAKEWRDEQLAAGVTIVTDEQLAEATKAAEVLTQRHRESAAIFEKSKKQVVLLQPDRFGAKFKGLVDLAPEGETFLADLKTTSDFSLEGFGRAIARYGYHVQAGLYLDLWNAQVPDDQRDSFRFVWQDSSPPYEVAVTELSAFEIACGLEFGNWLTLRIIRAARTNTWPMLHEDRVPIVGRPAWASMAEDEKMAEPVEAPSKEAKRRAKELKRQVELAAIGQHEEETE